jgi:hypothetical protein
MPDISPENLKLILGIASVALALFAPKLWEKLKPFFPKKETLKKLNPFSSSGKVVNDGLEISSVLDIYTIHDVVEDLMEDRKKAKDEEGLLLIGTFGKHLYDNRIGGKK